MNRLAIIGAGSSGLVTLKTALEHLPNWEIVCYEKSKSIQGCWGNPYPNFISTSTKYTTQFSCYQKFNATVNPDRSQKSEFFRGGEYGQYLESFAEEFGLKNHIKLEHEISQIRRNEKEWVVTVNEVESTFSQVIVCTGLTEKPKETITTIESIHTMAEIESVEDQTVVVMGGGESAADIANRLSKSERNNKVYLSLKGGIRVSPRYHPIRGVPSDFLRNRLMLNISRVLRNQIGQKFVEGRIKYQETFEKLFPRKEQDNEIAEISQRRKEWDLRLTKASKDSLFSMFHNKSDGFLEAVGEGAIQIIGEPTTNSYNEYYQFQSKQKIEVKPSLIIPMIGYQSDLAKMFDDTVKVNEFYLGCLHRHYANLYLIGFARPIIGNIPSISEQQALYVIKHIKGEIQRPENIRQLYQEERTRLHVEFPKLNLDAIYPVEMFPYCDTLAKQMGTYPDKSDKASWLNIITSPASTLHYKNYDTPVEPVYTPKLLLGLLFIISFCDKVLERVSSKTRLLNQSRN